MLLPMWDVLILIDKLVVKYALRKYFSARLLMLFARFGLWADSGQSSVFVDSDLLLLCFFKHLLLLLFFFLTSFLVHIFSFFIRWRYIWDWGVEVLHAVIKFINPFSTDIVGSPCLCITKSFKKDKAKRSTCKYGQNVGRIKVDSSRVVLKPFYPRGLI